MGTEHDKAVKAVCDFVASARGNTWVTHQNARVQGTPGAPDMCLVMPTQGGRGPLGFAFMEVKVGDDNLRPDQIAFKVKVEDAGVLVVVGRARDLADAFGYE